MGDYGDDDDDGDDDDGDLGLRATLARIAAFSSVGLKPQHPSRTAAAGDLAIPRGSHLVVPMAASSVEAASTVVAEGSAMDTASVTTTTIGVRLTRRRR